MADKKQRQAQKRGKPETEPELELHGKSLPGRASGIWDSYLVCDSGRKFRSVRGVLALNSKVIQDLLTSCSQDTPVSRDPVEIPLVGESDEDVELLWELWHGKRQLLHEIMDVTELKLRPQALELIESVARLADKYQSEGKFMQEVLHKWVQASLYL